MDKLNGNYVDRYVREQFHDSIGADYEYRLAFKQWVFSN